MAELRCAPSLNTPSVAKYCVVSEKNIFTLRDFPRLNWAPRCSIYDLHCNGSLAKAEIMAVRNYECVRSLRATSRRNFSYSRVERVRKGFILSCASSAHEIEDLSFDRGDGRWNNKVRKTVEDIPGTGAVVQYRQQGPETQRDGVLDLENRGVLDSEKRGADTSEKDEEHTANAFDQFDEREDSGNKSVEADWWWEEASEENTSPSTRVEKNREQVEDDSDRFRTRNGREVYGERTYLIGVDCKGAGKHSLFSIKDSLRELAQLADTAGLLVVGSTYQKLEYPNPKTYIGFGKVAEIQAAVHAFKVETIIFDDELSPGQLRNLEKAFKGDVRVCDRTALILDIFKQRAATREATLQVELAQFEYQLPRLTRMWTHLERQAGGMVKGMGEKQIEIDKRILRTRISGLKAQLESVRDHRKQYRDRRAAVPIPVVSLVGYTNAGKSTFLNRLSGANVLAEDRLFATLDPTTRRVQLPNGKECLFTDTVGFIQKLPTQLVAAFRATLEEIIDSSLLVHMVDISHPMAKQQVAAVNNVLAELDVHHIPLLTVWNKIDNAENPEYWRAEAAAKENVICVSALTGEGIDDFYDAVERNLKDTMVRVETVIPYDQGDLISIIHRLGVVDEEEYVEQGTFIRAHVPLSLSSKLCHLRQVRT